MHISKLTHLLTKCIYFVLCEHFHQVFFFIIVSLCSELLVAIFLLRLSSFFESFLMEDLEERD